MKNANLKTGMISILTALLFIFPGFTVYATSTDNAVTSTTSIDYISVQSYETLRTNPVKITGEYPYFDNSVGSAAFTLNNEVSKIIDRLENDAKKDKAVSLDYYFETKESDYDGNHYVSVVIYSSTTTGSTLDKIDAFVYDGETMALLTLDDIIGSNSASLANQVVFDEIRGNPDKYLSTFTGIEEDQDFYVDGDVVYLAFDKYEIAPGSEGIQTIPLYINGVTNMELVRTDYKVSQNYNIRIVPLRLVGETFGFEIRGYLPNVAIQSSSTGKTINIIVGENKYRGFDDKTDQTLEVAPEIRDGATYVPISFIDTILGLSYHVNSSGTILISQYIAPEE